MDWLKKGVDEYTISYCRGLTNLDKHLSDDWGGWEDGHADRQILTAAERDQIVKKLLTNEDRS
jgi:hypothetical protein